MNLAVVFPLVVVIICAVTLFGCYIAFDRLQTQIEQTRGGQRRLTIALAAGTGQLALATFWCCFAFSAGLLQALGLNL
jgi:NAD/NADP transhydrogenase beta subunit